jgi:hypothetical protein
MIGDGYEHGFDREAAAACGKDPRHDKAARRRLCANVRRPLYGQRGASSGTIPVAVAAKVVGVAMVDFTESPPFEIDGVSPSHSARLR